MVDVEGVVEAAQKGAVAQTTGVVALPAYADVAVGHRKVGGADRIRVAHLGEAPLVNGIPVRVQVGVFLEPALTPVILNQLDQVVDNSIGPRFQQVLMTSPPVNTHHQTEPAGMARGHS